MPGARLYVDTSALLKCYVAEKNSDEVEAFLATYARANRSNLVLSSLTKLEWHCAMGRRERAGEIDLSYHQLARKAFVERWDSGYYDVLRVENALYDKALSLIASVTPALRALDALHLTVAITANVKEMVTADKVMAERARELQLNVHYFK